LAAVRSFDLRLASDVKLLQFDEGLASSRARFQFQQGAHASQDRRIQAIGLRQLAGRLGEAARLTRIDLDERNARCAERTFESAMIGSGRFEHDPVGGRLREPFDERFVTSLRVGETPGGAVGQPMGVEMVFRHIDADGIVLHLFRASACHSGLSPGYPFRPKEKTRAIKL
jgi:hypothetical protein